MAKKAKISSPEPAAAPPADNRIPKDQRSADEVGAEDRAGTFALIAAAVAMGAVAFSLEITTLIAAVGLAVWAAKRYAFNLIQRAGHEPVARQIAADLAALVALLVTAFVVTGAASAIWSEYKLLPQ